MIISIITHFNELKNHDNDTNSEDTITNILNNTFFSVIYGSKLHLMVVE